MHIPFLKAHGNGNDFILIHHRDVPDLDRVYLAQQLCARHTGIGSDGLIILAPDATTDYHMDFYNPDGSQSFCGNGSRCAYYAAQKWGMVEGEARFRAIDGEHRAHAFENQIAVSMRDTPLASLRTDHDFLNTGSPHAMVWVEDVAAEDLAARALPIRHSEAYAPGGTNVNLVQRTPTGIAMRTFERGVEAETLSCGTGVTAAALVAVQRFDLNTPVQVQTPGGLLQVACVQGEKGFSEIQFSGPVTEVFTGTFEWK